MGSREQLPQMGFTLFRKTSLPCCTCKGGLEREFGPEPAPTSMRISTVKTAIILSNIVLAAMAVWGGFQFLPQLYQQAHFQFTDPRGGPSMWPATFNRALYVASFYACLLTLSSAFHRPLRPSHRCAALVVLVLLLAGWWVNAWLASKYMPQFFGPLRPSILSSMLSFEGLPCLLTAIVALAIAVAGGRGLTQFLAQSCG